MIKVEYQPLATEQNGPLPKAGKFMLPKVTRFKVIAASVIIILTVLLVTLTCLQTGVFSRSQVCNIAERKSETIDSVEEVENVRVRVHHTKRHLPQCIIIGVRKAGTRALLTYLDVHPDIVTAHQEQHFFDDDDFYRQGLEVYRKKMPYSFNDQITVEKTPAYFTEVEVPERIYRMNSTIKLLLIVRDPVERTISDYAQIAESKKRKHKPFASFEDMVLDKDDNINISYKAIRRSVYCKHLGRWLELFKLEQIHIVDGENMVKNPIEEIEKVEDFLGLAHKVKKENFYFNRTKGFYCVKTESKEKCLSESKGREHPTVSPRVIQRLKEFYAPYNEKFFNMIGTRFNWTFA